MRLAKLKAKIPFIPKSGREIERFRELTDQHVKFFYNMALKYTGNRFDAEDIVQETLLTAFKNFRQLRDKAKFKSWCFAILRHIYLKRLKQKEFSKSNEFDDAKDYVGVLASVSQHLDLQTAYENKVESEQINAILGKLPEKYKSPLILYFMDDMSYQEISELLGIPIGTVMSRLSRGKQILKKEVVRLYIRNKLDSNVLNFQEIMKKG